MSPENHAAHKLNIFSSDGKTIVPTATRIIRETALTVNINGQTAVIIACTGKHPKELAAGYLRSEGIIAAREDIAKITVNNKNNRVDIVLKNKSETSPTFIKNIASSGARGRIITSASFRPLLVPDDFVISAELALQLMENLLDKSILHNETHGTHCSALADTEDIIALREDIGRHNTIDMLGGYALLNKIDLSAGIILTTGRISAEIVYKVWNLGVPVIISHSAPTTKAAELVRLANITLIGYVRGGRMSIYSHERRVKI
jgi:FdhD protein